MLRPHTATAALLLLSLCLTGCVRREGRNSDCAWPAEPDARALNPSQSDDARHLRADLEFAEDLAVRYMDAHHGPRSENFQSHKTADQALNGCLTDLAAQIGQSHHVPPRELKQLFGQRILVADVAMNLPFFLLYCLLAAMVAGSLFRRHPPADGWTAPLVMVSLCSLAFGTLGTLVGEQCSTLAENLRVGTGHLSYRLDRLPWARHRVAFLVLCVVLFWLAALARYGMSRRSFRSAASSAI